VNLDLPSNGFVGSTSCCFEIYRGDDVISTRQKLEEIRVVLISSNFRRN
jgi:hypothetical protein